LELVDSNGKTIDYLTFPVPPEQMTYDDVKVANIKKTLGGVTSLDTETFIPVTLQMQGTFGRKFRIMLSPPHISDVIDAEKASIKGYFDKPGRGSVDIKTPVFIPFVKTGYGAIKLLESMIDKSSGLGDDNKPLRLYLYNPALGHRFLVKANSLQISQDKNSSNMLWRYSLTLTAIAPLDRLRELNSKSLLAITSIAALQTAATKLARDIKRSI